MTRTLRTVLVAGGIALATVSARAQEPEPFHGHKLLAPPLASQHLDVSGRLEQLDARIAMLTADMRMFAGDMKIQVMADLIEALVERQYLIERRAHPMHEMMEKWMPHSTRPAPPGAVPDSDEMAPETMCSPHI